MVHVSKKSTDKNMAVTQHRHADNNVVDSRFEPNVAGRIGLHLWTDLYQSGRRKSRCEKSHCRIAAKQVVTVGSGADSIASRAVDGRAECAVDPRQSMERRQTQRQNYTNTSETIVNSRHDAYRLFFPGAGKKSRKSELTQDHVCK